jgi:hypothetical protein
VAENPTDSNNNSLLTRVSRLDIVDRNLLITATNRVIHMIELETQIANAEAGGSSIPDESANPKNT